MYYSLPTLASDMEQKHWDFVGAILSGMSVTVSVTWQSTLTGKQTNEQQLPEIVLKILYGVRHN
jgi:hypothetical protein